VQLPLFKPPARDHHVAKHPTPNERQHVDVALSEPAPTFNVEAGNPSRTTFADLRSGVLTRGEKLKITAFHANTWAI